MAPRARALLFFFAFVNSGCDRLRELDAAEDDSLVKVSRTRLTIGQRVPNDAETRVVGPADSPIKRGRERAAGLVSCSDCPWVFKDEERNQSDRWMTPRLRSNLLQLSKLVSQTWPKLELRVTEAWDD